MLRPCITLLFLIIFSFSFASKDKDYSTKNTNSRIRSSRAIKGQNQRIFSRVIATKKERNSFGLHRQRVKKPFCSRQQRNQMRRNSIKRFFCTLRPRTKTGRNAQVLPTLIEVKVFSKVYALAY